MPKVIKKRAEKKPETSTEENVREAMSGIFKEAQERKQIVIKVSAALAALLVVVIGTYIYVTSTAKKAALLEYEGYKLFNNLYIDVPMPDAERMQQAFDRFKSAAAAKPTAMRVYYTGAAAYELGKYDEAEAAFREVLAKYPDDPRFVPLAHLKLARTYMKKDNKEAALAEFKVMEGLWTDSMKDLALVESARLLESMGRDEDAKLKYETLLKLMPASPYASEALSKTEKEPEAGADPSVLQRPTGQ